VKNSLNFSEIDELPAPQVYTYAFFAECAAVLSAPPF